MILKKIKHYFLKNKLGVILLLAMIALIIFKFYSLKTEVKKDNQEINYMLAE